METPAKNRDHFLRTCLIAALIVISGFKSDPGVAPARTAGANNSGPSYSLLKSEQDIRLYSRWLPVTDTRKAKQLKAELICKTRLETVLTLISRDENFTRWMKGAETCSRLKTIDTHHWYTYVRFSVPWPLKDQDCAMACELIENPDGKSFILKEKNLENYLRTIDGVTRIPHLECEWSVLVTKDNLVKIEYTLFTNQVPKYPLWITDPIIQNNLMRSMIVFRDLLMNQPS